MPSSPSWTLRALSILLKLHRKGLKTVCVPKSAENHVAATRFSFGFNSALSFAIEMLDRTRQAAQSARKIGVVEVPGEHAGWLALQSGMAACADAVLIPEIPYDLHESCGNASRKTEVGPDVWLGRRGRGAVPVTGSQPQSGHARD